MITFRFSKIFDISHLTPQLPQFHFCLKEKGSGFLPARLVLKHYVTRLVIDVNPPLHKEQACQVSV